MKRQALLLLGMICLTGLAGAMGSTNYDLSWHVIGGGGGAMSSTNYRMAGTVGQVIEVAESTNYRLETGYWSGIYAEGEPAELYTKTDVGVTSNITLAGPEDIAAYLPSEYAGVNISDSVVLNVNVTDVTPGNSADDAYTDITINIGDLDIETCKVFKAGMGFLPEVSDVTTRPTVKPPGEPAFSRNMANNTVTVRLYVGDPLLAVLPAAGLPVVIVENGHIAAVDATTVIDITLETAPDGLSGYNLTISFSNTSIAEILTVEFPTWATISAHGTLPADTVWLKAVDMMGQIDPGATNVTLAMLTIRGDAEGSCMINAAVTQMDPDGAGEPITPSVDPGELTVSSVVPLPGYDSPPTDPDGDGLYEDLNGNGDLDFNDVVQLFKYLEWIEANEPIACFDFNGNGRLDFADIVELFKEV